MRKSIDRYHRNQQCRFGHLCKLINKRACSLKHSDQATANRE